MKNNILITGGAGFIGINLAEHLARIGCKISILDNFSRKGTRENILWLKQAYPAIEIIEGDIRSARECEQAVVGKNFIIHLAAQVAVTTSVINPREDFEINALGTFNVLEAMRNKAPEAGLIYASTNKVYGGMENIHISESEARYYYSDFPGGIPESETLDFHSPYGCSKGAADQYVRDYNRIYGLKTVVFRQSCIYGPHQFGLEDQGWVAWFIIASILAKPMTIYGDGKQVRDILCIHDLVRAYEIAMKQIDTVAGKIYNVGGGPDNTLAIWSEFRPLLEKLLGRNITIKQSDWRPGDQKVYVSDITKINAELAWKPEIGVEEGITQLFSWVQDNKNIIKKYF